MDVLKYIDGEVILGIDASTTNIGIAYYVDGVLNKTENLRFKDTYSLEKLEQIVGSVEHIISSYNPKRVILEEPITPNIYSKQFRASTRSITSLNQVAGAICAVAFLYKIEVMFIHNRTAKAAIGVKDKTMANKRMVSKYPILEGATDHECDAVLMVEAYKKLNVKF